MRLTAEDIAYFRSIVEGTAPHEGWRRWFSANARRLELQLRRGTYLEVERASGRGPEALRAALGAVLDRAGLGASPLPHGGAGPEEYAACSAVLARECAGAGAERLVIARSTRHPRRGLGAGEGEEADRLMGGIPGLDREMAEDFLARNREGGELRLGFDLGVPYHLLSDEEWGRYFGGEALEAAFSGEGGPQGWDRFHADYPGSGGIIALSRVGFGRGGSRALVFLERRSDRPTGPGFYCVLGRSGGAWSVIGTAEAPGL